MRGTCKKCGRKNVLLDRNGLCKECRAEQKCIVCGKNLITHKKLKVCDDCYDAYYMKRKATGKIYCIECGKEIKENEYISPELLCKECHERRYSKWYYCRHCGQLVPKEEYLIERHMCKTCAAYLDSEIL